MGGASAEEPRDYLVRDQFFESHAQNAVLKAVMDLVDGDGTKFDAIELYSCFPCVPKMARRTLGLGPDVQPTVTGGLTFFGAPLNTYMTHAACAMVRSCATAASSACSTARAGSSPSIMRWCCRAGAEAGARSRTPACRPRPTAASGAAPEFVTEASGKGKVESFTVIYGGKGEVKHGVVMLRTAAMRARWRGCRPTTVATLAHLRNMDRTPVGSLGDIVTAEDGVLEWRVG